MPDTAQIARQMQCLECGRIFGHPMALRDHHMQAHSSFEGLQRYWNDPAERERIERAKEAHYKRANALIDAAISRHRAQAGDAKRNGGVA
ncbi:hypothetical protein [Novosphingopyxis sp. YJ-S2-01]|uniref:hypothetical protein n=1 Tax=Novosphingopyxis sp. YJ-S2-01 TaxID=2794021 RepID=UPI0018DB75A2|nr:hypothetical protein [Novosphingopyxis sp. YJ-S2-01]MBH9537494.1 hypothetical protein [Novosphingopyxis sp. YJ-S2-01]